MSEAPSSVLSLTTLAWPADLHIPSKRFRLFIAADVSAIAVDTLADFATKAIEGGMVYFCAWGPDCERFHDVVDAVIVGDGTVDVATNYRIVTVWHPNETIEEALEFFINWTRPSEELISGSHYWLALNLNNPEWENIIWRELQDAKFPLE